MSNKIKLFVVSILSIASLSVFASSSKYVNSATFIPAETDGFQNHYIYFDTRHQYFIQNNTSHPYTAKVCYTTYVCPLTPNQVEFYSCDQIPVGIGEIKSAVKTQNIQVIYGFHGTCTVTSFTDIFAEGGQQESNATGRLVVQKDGDQKDKK